VALAGGFGSLPLQLVDPTVGDAEDPGHLTLGEPEGPEIDDRLLAFGGQPGDLSLVMVEFSGEVSESSREFFNKFFVPVSTG